MSALAAGITAAGSLLAGFFGYKQNQKYNREQMRLQDMYNTKNWSMQNAYNSPQAQMARLRAAGLNPNLIYQNGGANIGAGEIGTPNSMPVQAPDYGTAITHGIDAFQMSLQADSVQAEVDKKQAETAGILAENKVKDTPLGAMAEYNLLNQEERDYYANLFGVSPSSMSTMSLRGMSYVSQLKQSAQDVSLTKQERKNLEETLNILYNEDDITFHQATSAFFAALMDGMNLVTEGEKQGYSFNPVVNNRGTKIRIKDNKEGFNYVLETFIRMYKEAKWQSSDVKHIFDTANSTIGSISGAFSAFKPTKQVKSVTEDLDFNKWRNRGRRTTHYEY